LGAEPKEILQHLLLCEVEMTMDKGGYSLRKSVREGYEVNAESDGYGCGEWEVEDGKIEEVGANRMMVVGTSWIVLD
jgi:hypothetical protein